MLFFIAKQSRLGFSENEIHMLVNYAVIFPTSSEVVVNSYSRIKTNIEADKQVPELL